MYGPFVLTVCTIFLHNNTIFYSGLRRVWRFQRGNQNPYIEEEQTIQWPKEKGKKDKQRSTKHIYKTKDRVKYDENSFNFNSLLILHGLNSNASFRRYLAL